MKREQLHDSSLETGTHNIPFVLSLCHVTCHASQEEQDRY